MNQLIKKSALLIALPLAILTASCKGQQKILLSKVRGVSNPTFGNVDFEISSADFVKAGFNYDDLIEVKIKDYDGNGNDAIFNTAFVKSFPRYALLYPKRGAIVSSLILFW